MVKYFIVLFRSENDYGNVPCYISESFEQARDHALFQNLKSCIKNKITSNFIDHYYVSSVEHFTYKNPEVGSCEYGGSTVEDFFDIEELYYDTFNNQQYMNLRADFFG